MLDLQTIRTKSEVALKNLTTWQRVGIGIGVLALISFANSANQEDLESEISAGHTCEGIVSEVIALSKERGPEIFEINNITTYKEWVSGAPYVSCRGTAETSAGSQLVEFETEVSPQGNLMLHLSYPNGLR